MRKIRTLSMVRDRREDEKVGANAQIQSSPMNCAYGLALLCVFLGCSPAPVTEQVVVHQLPVWEPPDSPELPQGTKPTVPKEMVTGFRLSGREIVLENTKLEDLQKQFGGAIGHRGEAATSLRWLCIRGADTEGDWVLWLMSSEIDAGTVGGFRWQLERPSPRFDSKCAAIPRGQHVELPIPLRVGMEEREFFHILGQPSKQSQFTSFYLHEHGTTLRGEPYTVMNTLAVIIHGGIVRSIEVWKSTTS